MSNKMLGVEVGAQDAKKLGLSWDPVNYTPTILTIPTIPTPWGCSNLKPT